MPTDKGWKHDKPLGKYGYEYKIKEMFICLY